MDIQDLKDKKLLDTRNHQVKYQALIKRKIMEHGLDRQKLLTDLSEGISDVSKTLTNNALKLGMQWLSK